MSNQSTAGFVYLIRAESGHYKIGKAVDAERRAGQFTLQLPFKTEVVKVIPCENRHYTETYLHQKFGQFHVNGEWFSLSPLAVLYWEFWARLASYSPSQRDIEEIRACDQAEHDRTTARDLSDGDMIKAWMSILIEREVRERGGTFDYGPTGF